MCRQSIRARFYTALMEVAEGVWPEPLPAIQVRIARPTDRLDEILDFYCGDLGLPQLYRTRGDQYDVAMVGLPGERYHLEFTSHVDGSPGPAPSDENLLVFYFADAEQMSTVVGRLSAAGHAAVPLANPWWGEHGAITFADPDGWRIVLMPNPIPLST